MAQKVDLQSCKKVLPPHPCDPPRPCDPFEEPEGKCPDPVLCREKIKNPAYPGETTRCRTGAFMNVQICAKEIPPHPCDPPVTGCIKFDKKPCRDPVLCYERVKNPEAKVPRPPECSKYPKKEIPVFDENEVFDCSKP